MKNNSKVSQTDLVIMIVSFLVFLLLVLTSAKAMECKSEIIKTTQGVEVCWVCVSNGEVVSIKCYK